MKIDESIIDSEMCDELVENQSSKDCKNQEMFGKITDECKNR